MKKSSRILYVSLVATVVLVVVAFLITAAIVNNSEPEITTRIVSKNINMGDYLVGESFEVPFNFENNNKKIECGMVTLTWDNASKLLAKRVKVDTQKTHLANMVVESTISEGKAVIKWMGSDIGEDLASGELFVVEFENKGVDSGSINVAVNDFGYVTSTANSFEHVDYAQQLSVQPIQMYRGDSLYMYNVSLEGSIVLNYYMDFTESTVNEIAAGKVKFKFDIDGANANRGAIDVTEDHKVTDPENEYYGKYMLSVPLYATEMTADVTGYVIVDGVEGEKYTENIRNYAEIILEIPEFSDYHNLVKAMLNYGAKSQLYFDRNDYDLADKNITFIGSDTSVVREHLEKFVKPSITGELPQGMTYKETTIVLFGNVVIRHYFEVNDEALAQQYGLKHKSGNLYYYESNGKLPQYYALQDSVTIGGMTIKYSIMNYANSAKDYNGERSNEVHNVVYSMYEYFKAASGYVEENYPELPEIPMM